MDPRIITKAIKELSPNAEYAFSGDDLSTLEWHNKKAPRPTDEEILAHCEVVIANLESAHIAREAAAASAIAKLEAIGLTTEEISALRG